MVFGFGLPYTACTRTPFSRNMLFVGVPPRDIFLQLTRVLPDGTTLVERKRAALLAFIGDTAAVAAELAGLIRAGEHDVEALVAARRAVALADSDAGTSASDDFALRRVVLQELQDAIVATTRAWIQRLDMVLGLQRMAVVNEDFKLDRRELGAQNWAGAVAVKERPHARWPDLRYVLQQDAQTRERIR